MERRVRNEATGHGVGRAPRHEHMALHCIVQIARHEFQIRPYKIQVSFSPNEN